jgi:maltose O-acetyltransferase
VTDYFTGNDRSNRERMLAGDWYVSDDPESWDQFKRAVRLQTRYTAAYAEDPDAARPILEELLGHLGEQAHVRPPLFVDYGSYISVGARTFINYNLTALDVAPIVIGEDCQIGPNVQLLTPVHPLEAQPRKDRLEAARPITIGNNVWLGGGAIICPGVSIGDDSVIGAGAVVTRDIPPRSLAVGSPARVIREL